jgi:hypothetical protein
MLFGPRQEANVAVKAEYESRVSRLASRVSRLAVPFFSGLHSHWDRQSARIAYLSKLDEIGTEAKLDEIEEQK